jgi:hypothetical protein
LRTSCWIVGTASPSSFVRLGATSAAFRAKLHPNPADSVTTIGHLTCGFPPVRRPPGSGVSAPPRPAGPPAWRPDVVVGGNPRAWRPRPRASRLRAARTSDDAIRRTPYVISTRACPRTHGHDRQEYPTFCPQVKAKEDLPAEDRACPCGSRLLRYVQPFAGAPHSRGRAGFPRAGRPASRDAQRPPGSCPAASARDAYLL